MSKHKQWSLQFLVFFLSMLTLLAGFNIWMDPYWMFGWKHKYNAIQLGFNERMMKTDEITYQPFTYDTLLLGNSRTTYIDPHEFHEGNVYNYSVSGLHVDNYLTMITYAEHMKGKPFDTIILAIDFFSISSDPVDESIDPYVALVSDPFFRMYSVLSLDMLHHSITNFRLSTQDRTIQSSIYGHDNYRISIPQSETALVQLIRASKQLSKERMLQSSEIDFETYKQMITKIKQSHPHTKFIIFSPPVHSEVFQNIEQLGDMNDYRTWLRITVDVFGEVNHFMYESSVTQKNSNFVDGSHFNNQVGVWIAHRISRIVDPTIPADLGIVLNRDNVEQYLTTWGQEVKP